MEQAQKSRTPATEEDAALINRFAASIGRLARSVSRGTVVAPGDLWSSGALGLLDAAKRFDPSRDVKFETFAEHRIRGAMIDELRRQDHLPRRLRAEVDRVAKAKQRLASRLGREMTAEDLAAELGMKLEELGEIDLLTLPVVAIEPRLQLVSEEPPPDEKVERAELLRRLTEAVESLPERLQTLLALHYVDGLKYKEIAKVIEVSDARVCQLHSEAIARLRELLGVRGDE